MDFNRYEFMFNWTIGEKCVAYVLACDVLSLISINLHFDKFVIDKIRKKNVREEFYAKLVNFFFLLFLSSSYSMA